MDINDPLLSSVLEKEKFDIINHHAAQLDVRVSVADPLFDAKVNILGGVNLFQSACTSGVKKIIFASSGGTVYGEQAKFPADETHPTEPVSPYGIAKLTCEKYLFYYKEVLGIDFACLRYANIYGPRQNPFGEAGVVAIFINKMLEGSQPFINGDGKNTRDYVYVGDAVKANLMALDKDFKGTYNIGTGIENDTNYIFNTLCKQTGSDCKEIHVEAKIGEQIRSVLSYEKIYGKYGWKPDVRFDFGLSLTVEWFKNYRRKS
jgi:UDP-glucose 4-epimerase